MVLLTERLNFEQAGIVLEADQPDQEGSHKNLYMRGIFLQGGVRNHNELVYPIGEIRTAVDNINARLKRGETVYGECDHPEELTINIERISHIITEMWMDGNAGMGKLKLLPTPRGNIIRTIIEAGGRLGVSSRGVGNVDDHGEVSGFDMITVDIVANPSAPNAYPKPVYESLDTRRGRILLDLAEAVSHDPKAQRHFYKEVLAAIGHLKLI